MYYGYSKELDHRQWIGDQKHILVRDSDKVRDPNVYAGTMGRYTSGPQGIVGTNYISTVTMILIQFCDSDLNRRKTRIHYNDALLLSGFCS